MADKRKKTPCAVPGCKDNSFAAVAVCTKHFAAIPMDRRGTPLPPYVDVRTFDDMPLNVRAVRDSDTLATVSDEGFRAAFQLWCAAWHQVPASSVPSDDKQLAYLAGYGRDVRKWKKIKNEALRGFLICSDGRLYHLYMANKAWHTWLKSEAGKNSANWRWENTQPTDNTQDNTMRSHSDGTSERIAKPDANEHANGHANAERLHMPSQCSEQNRVESKNSNPPAAPESVTPREAREPAADAADKVPADRIKPITEQIWAMANQLSTMERWHVGGKTDDYRAVIGWVKLGWTETDILEAAQRIIGKSGEIRSLWGLLAKAMPDAVHEIRNGTNDGKVIPGSEINTPAEREFNRDVGRYLGHLERGLWISSYGNINDISDAVKSEANRRLQLKTG